MTHAERFHIINNLPCGEERERVLADFHRDLPESVTAGRNITAGYIRGGGLCFGGLPEAIKKDPIYQESMNFIRGQSLVEETRLMNIFLIMKYGIKDRSGDIIEFGSYRCGSAIFIASVAQRLGFTGAVYALDTFEGIPAVDDALDFHTVGEFRETCFEDLVRCVRQFSLNNLILVKGPFDQSFPCIQNKIQNIVLAHINCFVYSATKYAITALPPHMHKMGGYLVFNDPLYSSALGALQAVEEMAQEQNLRAEQAYPQLVYRMPQLLRVNPS